MVQTHTQASHNDFFLQRTITKQIQQQTTRENNTVAAVVFCCGWLTKAKEPHRISDQPTIYRSGVERAVQRLNTVLTVFHSFRKSIRSRVAKEQAAVVKRRRSPPETLDCCVVPHWYSPCNRRLSLLIALPQLETAAFVLVSYRVHASRME